MLTVCYADIITAPESKHGGGLHSLKRIGTVLGRRRQSTHPYGRASSPERKSSSNLPFGGFGKGKSKDRDPPGSSSGHSHRPVSPLRRLSTSRASDVSGSPKATRLSSSEKPNGTTSPEPTNDIVSPGPSAVNGTSATQDTIPELKEPLSPPPAAEVKPEV